MLLNMSRAGSPAGEYGYGHGYGYGGAGDQQPAA
jgi:hypothetical protein